jgi:phosphoesterase RecJ-like protein
VSCPHGSTKMKNNTFEEIWGKLEKSKRILISLHPKPDGDSLGSCTALKYVLEKEGKKVTLISNDEISENLKNFDFCKEVKFKKSFNDYDLNYFDTLIFTDFASLKEYPEKIRNKEFPKEMITLNIDHHPTNGYFGKLNYVDKNSPSCCSVLFDLFKKVNVNFDKEVCRRLLLGICTDTNFGEFGNSEESLEKMAFLIKNAKINFQEEFINPIKNNNPWKLKKLWGILLINMKKEEINGKVVAYSWATEKEYKKYGLESADIRLGIICMQDIANLDLIFTLSEIDGKIKGSFRSSTLDTTIYSLPLGGGGHKEASAFILEGTDIKKELEKVLNLIKEKGFVEIE